MDTYKVSASNMNAFYECGYFQAEDEQDAIRQAKAKCGCADGLVFRATFQPEAANTAGATRQSNWIR